jgi:hypothetical protein
MTRRSWAPPALTVRTKTDAIVARHGEAAHMDHGELVFINDRPMLKWADFAMRTGMVAVFVWLYLREYHVRLFHPVADITIVAIFWLLGWVAVIRVYAPPRVRLTLGRKDVVVRERWIGPERIERFVRSRLPRPVFAEEEDYDGDPYFRTTITTPRGRTISFSEHTRRPIVEAAHERLIAAIG